MHGWLAVWVGLFKIIIWTEGVIWVEFRKAEEEKIISVSQLREIKTLVLVGEIVCGPTEIMIE